MCYFLQRFLLRLHKIFIKIWMQFANSKNWIKSWPQILIYSSSIWIMIDKSEFADPDLQVWSLPKSSIQIQLVDIIYKIRLFCKSKESHESLVLKTSQILTNPCKPDPYKRFNLTQIRVHFFKYSICGFDSDKPKRFDSTQFDLSSYLYFLVLSIKT